MPQRGISPQQNWDLTRLSRSRALGIVGSITLRRDILPPVSVPSGVITTWAAALGGSFLFQFEVFRMAP